MVGFYYGWFLLWLVFSHPSSCGKEVQCSCSGEIYEALDLTVCPLTTSQTYVARSHWKNSENILANKVVKQMGMHKRGLIPFLNYPYVTAFLADLNANGNVAPATTRKLLDVIAKSETKLKVEIAATVDAGKPFVKKTYSLEGDGPLVVTAYHSIEELENYVRLMHMPNVNRIASDLAAIAETDLEKQQLLQQWQDYACQCVQPGFDYFLDTYASADNLSHPMCCFKAAHLVDPRKVNDLMPSVTDIKGLGNFPFIKNSDLEKLILELLAYMAASNGINNSIDILNGGKRHEKLLPSWSMEARKLFLSQPTSAAAERAFSLLKALFNYRQEVALEDYIETSLMLQYNGH